MTALIDADSIVYIVAWHHKELADEFSEQLVRNSCDQIVQNILSACNATRYLGSFSSSPNFRHEHYKFAPYKGTRKEKAEWVIRWEGVIKRHLCTKWKFFIPIGIEADDVLSGAWHLINGESECVVCSPDKDLIQIPGYYYDYHKAEGMRLISEQEASGHLCKQMLTGDVTDNIKGIPGIGDVKADSMLSGKEDGIQCVKTAYYKHFGEYYGDIIYRETVIALQLLCPTHPLWEEYKQFIEGIVKIHVHPVVIEVEQSI